MIFKVPLKCDTTIKLDKIKYYLNLDVPNCPTLKQECIYLPFPAYNID